MFDFLNVILFGVDVVFCVIFVVNVLKCFLDMWKMRFIFFKNVSYFFELKGFVGNKFIESMM